MSYAVSLLLGIAVGAIYALLRVVPPAPPLVALVGLLGMLAGENATTWLKVRVAAHRAPSANASVARADGRGEG
ncbi:DUF1427 family protein [uncultured Sphingomonas sp.]|uniref:DUF1427 family protein n=1 Tax=uncultured Sphingomonas sp. TaxID=158754 RepID=UPI0035CA3A3D